MLTRCMRHQGEHPVSPLGAAEAGVPVDAHVCVPYPPTGATPNLILWTGHRHALALELKEPESAPGGAGRADAPAAPPDLRRPAAA